MTEKNENDYLIFKNEKDGCEAVFDLLLDDKGLRIDVEDPEEKYGCSGSMSCCLTQEQAKELLGFLSKHYGEVCMRIAPREKKQDALSNNFEQEMT